MDVGLREREEPGMMIEFWGTRAIERMESPSTEMVKIGRM